MGRAERGQFVEICGIFGGQESGGGRGTAFVVVGWHLAQGGQGKALLNFTRVTVV